MNPALLLVALLAGSGLLALGLVAFVLNWVDPVTAIVLIGLGAVLEAVMIILLVRSRSQADRAGRTPRRTR
jgi:CHASE2 domain-containing sensor protein